MGVVALRKLLVLLTGLVFLLGSGAWGVPAERAMASAFPSSGQAATSEDCATMARGGGRVSVPMDQPCECISLDCATQLGCICSPAMPAESTAIASPFSWQRLFYWPDVATMPVTLSIKPNLDPPIAA